MKPSFAQKFQYRFDNIMSRGTPAMVGMLFLLSLIVVLIAGAVIIFLVDMTIAALFDLPDADAALAADAVTLQEIPSIAFGYVLIG